MDNGMLEIAMFAIDLIGKIGIVTVDTGIAEHNIFLEDSVMEELRPKDIMTIGWHEHERITKRDVKRFLKLVAKRMRAEVFNNGRSYFFEGIYPTNTGSYIVEGNTLMPKKIEKSYYISWGS